MTVVVADKAHVADASSSCVASCSEPRRPSTSSPDLSLSPCYICSISEYKNIVMVSADNLHYDVLTLIFGYLPLPDLASVSAVSRSFQSSAEPWLYRTLPFTHAQAKRYALTGSSDSTSPFTVMLSQAHRASYVRTIDLRVIPNERRQMGVFDARWMADTREAVEKATNLTAFTCTIARAVPAFLSPLWEKSRLTYLRVNAALPSEAPMGLLKITTLRVLILEEPTYFVLHALPRWAEKLKNTLLHLTIVVSTQCGHIITCSDLQLDREAKSSTQTYFPNPSNT